MIKAIVTTIALVCRASSSVACVCATSPTSDETATTADDPNTLQSRHSLVLNIVLVDRARVYQTHFSYHSNWISEIDFDQLPAPDRGRTGTIRLVELSGIRFSQTARNSEGFEKWFS